MGDRGENLSDTISAVESDARSVANKVEDSLKDTTATPGTADEQNHIRVPLSLISPYMTTSVFQDIPDYDFGSGATSRCDERYSLTRPSVCATLADPTVTKLVRNELETIFHEIAAENVRLDVGGRYHWYVNSEMPVPFRACSRREVGSVMA